MTKAKTGNKVKVHYTGSLEDGTVFDSSVGGEPMEFTIGEKMMIPGFENAVLGMKEGESKTVSIPSEEAYGDRMEEMVVEIDRSQLPSYIEPTIGMMLQATSDEGAAIPVTVTEVTNDSVTLDGNHPLAGKDLVFEIKLEEIV